MLDRANADVKFERDFFVAQAAGDRSGDARFSFGQLFVKEFFIGF